MLGRLVAKMVFSQGATPKSTPASVTPRKVKFQGGARFERATTNIFDRRCFGKLAERVLRLGLRSRGVVTGAIAPLSHELVELGPVLRKAQTL